MKNELPPKQKIKEIQMDIDFPVETSKEDINLAVKKYNVHENLLTKKDSGWFACNMPIEEYIKERAEIAKEHDVGNLNFLSKMNNEWNVLYHGEQLSISKWKKEVERAKDREEIYRNDPNDDDDRRRRHLYGQD